jgi:predicted ABC-type ATPase
MKPTVIVVAGPNGAGKTTLARELILSKLPNHFEFLNADLIAEGLSPFKAHQVAYKAGRIFLDRFDQFASERKSFLAESTLSGYTLFHRLIRLRKLGYRIEILYLWLPSSEFVVKRAAKRVRSGGHNIPEATIIRRFSRSF